MWGMATGGGAKFAVAVVLQQTTRVGGLHPFTRLNYPAVAFAGRRWERTEGKHNKWIPSPTIRAIRWWRHKLVAVEVSGIAIEENIVVHYRGYAIILVVRKLRVGITFDPGRRDAGQRRFVLGRRRHGGTERRSTFLDPG